MKANEISTAILTSTLSASDIDQIIEAIKMKRAMDAKNTIRSITIGSKVTFESRKLGGTVTGTVVKTGTKNVVINAGPAGNWRVAASALTVV